MTGSDAERRCPECATPLRPTALFCPECGTPVLPAISNGLRISIEQLLNSLKPGQAEVIRRCAIPRWFDRQILAVLRDRPDDDTNARILEQLGEYSFVRQVAPGRYNFNTDVRELLLEQWRDRPDDFRPIQQRLLDYFQHQLETHADAERATWLREVTTYGLMLAASPIAKSVDPPSTTPDPALLRFRHAVEEALQSHRLAEAEALLQAAEENSSMLDPRLQSWLSYFRAGLDHADLRFDSARERLEELLEHPALSPELRILSLIRLGDVLVETSAWSAAIRAYKAALALPNLQPNQEAAIHLGLADAYTEIAISSGGWHLPSSRYRPMLRIGYRVFLALVIIPILVLVWVLRRVGTTVPPAMVLVHYQNWWLVRIFRAAREEVLTARKIYRERNDEANIARCTMRLIDNDVQFSLHQSAIKRGRRMLEPDVPIDSYRRARIQVNLAHALGEVGEYAEARQLIDQSLAVLRTLDDVRWIARALTVLGRIQIGQNVPDAALATYREGLELARQTGSVLSRERILYALRAWRRTSHQPLPAVDQLLRDEPSQRFVSRIPSFLLPFIQLGQTVMIPGLLLVAALITPKLQGQTFILADSFLIPGPNVFHFPLSRLIGSGLIMWFVMAAGYTLLGLSVLWRMPLERLERNQPDIIDVHSDHLDYIDPNGTLTQSLRWEDFSRITTIDRCIWRRPLAAFSRTLFTTRSGAQVLVPGTTGWYNSMVALCYRRAQEHNPSVEVKHADTIYMRSPMGWSMLLGLALLGVFIASSNGWIMALTEVLPPSLYAVLNLITYSGLLIFVPIAYWTGVQPLQTSRRFGTERHIPVWLALGGLAAIVAYVLVKDIWHRMPIFGLSLLLMGLYIVFETLYHRGFLRRWSRRLLRLLLSIEVLFLLVISLYTYPVVVREFYKARSEVYRVQDDDTNAAEDQIKSAELEPEGALLGSSSQGSLNEALVQTKNRDWQAAEQLYTGVINNPDLANTNEQAVAYHNLATIQLQQCMRQAVPARCSDLRSVIENEAAALQIFNQALPRSAALQNQAVAHSLLGETDQARELLLQAQSLTTNQQQLDTIAKQLQELEK